MIGTVLCRALLAKNYEVIILTRTPDHKIAPAPGISYAGWDLKNQTIDSNAITKADHIIHLAGADVGAKRWSAKRKKEIVDSRVRSGELLVKALRELTNQVKTVVSASGMGWYGPDEYANPERRDGFVETDPPAADFLGQTCQKWEAVLDPVKKMGKRWVRFRAGIVLSDKGGALAEFLKPLRFGIATILGSGNQIISWIHVDDMVRLYIMAIEDEKLEGVYNAVSPMPVSNKELILELAKVKRGKLFIPVYVPAFLLKLVFGEMSTEVLKSTRVSCDKIRDAGFTFQFPSIQSALKPFS